MMNYYLLLTWKEKEKTAGQLNLIKKIYNEFIIIYFFLFSRLLNCNLRNSLHYFTLDYYLPFPHQNSRFIYPSLFKIKLAICLNLNLLDDRIIPNIY